MDLLENLVKKSRKKNLYISLEVFGSICGKKELV